MRLGNLLEVLAHKKSVVLLGLINVEHLGFSCLVEQDGRCLDVLLGCLVEDLLAVRLEEVRCRFISLTLCEHLHGLHFVNLNAGQSMVADEELIEF